MRSPAQTVGLERLRSVGRPESSRDQRSTNGCSGARATGLSLENDSYKIGSGGKLVMGLMELTGVRKYR
jgi:hypothetical protein